MKDKSFITAAAVSFLLHGIFAAVSFRIMMPGFSNKYQAPERVFQVKTVEKKRQTAENLLTDAPLDQETLKFKSPKSGPQKEETPKPEKISLKSKIDSASQAVKRFFKDSDQEALELLPETKPAVISEQKKSRAAVSDLLTFDNIPNAVEVSFDEEGFSQIGEFAEKMPGLTPAGMPQINEIDRAGLMPRVTHAADEKIVKREDFVSLDDFLLTDLAVYVDPESGEKFYRVNIFAGPDAENLKPIAKEIVFLIDSSLSIQHQRAERFKKGVKYCISNLNERDVFNILIFKSGVTWFKPHSVKATPENIDAGIRFIEKIVADKQTDVYKAVVEALMVKEKMIPSYVVLLSDGRPTFGITDSRNVIDQITYINKGKRSIFSFSGGVRVNRYLLDFIAYKNRGWSEYAPRSAMINKRLSKLYDKIHDPILLNLRYQFSGLSEENVYPKSLPDFFRGALFTLYGKFENEREFSMQLLGESEGQTKEFIFSGNLADANQGEADIARQWAFNRIYYLISSLSGDKSKDESRMKAIDDLSSRFDIVTPYSESMKNYD